MRAREVFPLRKTLNSVCLWVLPIRLHAIEARVVAIALLLVLASVAGALVPRPTFAAEVRWQVAIAFPISYPAQGDGILDLAAMLAGSSAGAFTIEHLPFQKAIAPAAIAQAVRAGRFKAGYAWLAFDQERMPAAALLSSMPFGMTPWEFVAWWFEGGGSGLAQELYAAEGVRPILCGIAGPEAAGWFRNEIRSVEDFRGLRMRFGTGMARRIVERIGAVPVSLPTGEIAAALLEGRIDAAEMSMPVIDARQAFADGSITNYYLPGWHQSINARHLLVNAEAWEALSVQYRAQLEAACAATTLRTMARNEALQGPALAALRQRGVVLRSLPAPVLQALRKASDEVHADIATKDAAFKRIYESQRAFRAANADWRRLGYLAEHVQ